MDFIEQKYDGTSRNASQPSCHAVLVVTVFQPAWSIDFELLMSHDALFILAGL